MNVCIFTGVISLDKNNSDVRKKYLLERIRYFGNKNVNLKILSPMSSNVDYIGANNLCYNHYFFINRKGFKLLSLIFSVPKLVTLDCDILHCLNYQSFFIANFVNFFRKSRYLILFESMGLAYAESIVGSKGSIKVKILSPIITFLEREAFKKSDSVVVYTEILKEFAADHFNIKMDKISVVPHGVSLDTKDFTGFKIVDLLVDLPHKKPIVMYVGLLSKLHGTPYLMKIALELSIKRPNIFIMVLGTGPLKNQFERFIKEYKLTNIILTGYIPSEKVPMYLHMADVLLIPHSKCLQTELDPPTKLFEYLKAGKPIVSFDFKAISEIVGDIAVLVEPDNPSKFVDGVIEVLDNNKYYLELAQKAKLIVDQYSWKVAAEKQFNAYTNLAKKHNFSDKTK
ncbi:glycosyltransferase [Methanolobus halotolerans]|uniref:Uncharacterized protein n=1 Tax=Methanolobus halotolerans TaxID=2052935 RepID=A0A4E0Q0K6_9EURY|nr:glycosyltransferase [Methanolobus halotolerans]TGC11567.1 hypothetical protein CUN85_01490 [Methanolobus halotolerans]